MKSGKDIFDRNLSFRFIKLDNTFPQYLLKNKQKYEHLIAEIPKGYFLKQKFGTILRKIQHNFSYTE
ncbi:MAG: hypothetical protein ACI4S3_08805 [Candidatus Gastranaerophilaceae bacterium]